MVLPRLFHYFAALAARLVNDGMWRKACGELSILHPQESGSCGGSSLQSTSPSSHAVAWHLLVVEQLVRLRRIYSAHASRLTPALRGGALRAAASRPCLSTSCFGEVFITEVVHQSTNLSVCHPRTCSEDPCNVAMDPWDKPKGDKNKAMFNSRSGTENGPSEARTSCSTTKQCAGEACLRERNKVYSPPPPSPILQQPVHQYSRDAMASGGSEGPGLGAADIRQV